MPEKKPDRTTIYKNPTEPYRTTLNQNPERNKTLIPKPYRNLKPDPQNPKP